MTKYFLTVILLAIGLSAFCQNELVPQAVEEAFGQQFFGAERATWDLDDETNYVVDFKMGDDLVKATYDYDGEWVETETEIDILALPEIVKEQIANKFSKHEVIFVGKIETPDAANVFVVQLDDFNEGSSEIIFAKDGSIISKSKIEEEEDDEILDGDDGY